MVIDAVEPHIDFHFEVTNTAPFEVNLTAAVCKTSAASYVDNRNLPKRLGQGHSLSINCVPAMLNPSAGYEVRLVVGYSAASSKQPTQAESVFDFAFRSSALRVSARIPPTSVGPAKPSTPDERIATQIDAWANQLRGTVYLPLVETVEEKPNVVRIPAGTKFFLFDPTQRIVRFRMVTNYGKEVSLELPLKKQQPTHIVFIRWDVEHGAALTVDGEEVADFGSMKLP
jgi:hypothetical protein